MKKNLEADALAARLTAAANQPPAIVPDHPETVQEDELKSEQTRDKTRKTGRKEKNVKASEENTVPISLRPGASLWDRYVMAAAERTTKIGRVVSAQQIMLEVLERGI
jgi:hypothetical protein